MRYRRVAGTIALLLIVGLTVTLRGGLAQIATPMASPAVSLATPDASTRDIEPVQATMPYRLLLLVPFPQDPFWQDVTHAVGDRAVADGVSVDVVTLSTPSVPEQLEQIDGAIAEGYSGILLGAVDAAGIVPGIAAANAAGIPVLAIDTAPVAGEVVSVVRTDNVAAARLAGQFIGAELDGVGTVLNIQGDLANPVAQERNRGLRKGLGQFADIEVRSIEGDWQQDVGYRQTIEQLPQSADGTPVPPRPLVDAVFAANAAMALGAAQAVEEAKADSVIVVGFGATAETLEAIRNGILEAVVAELPHRAGALAVDAMVTHLNGDSVPPTIDSGSVLVTGPTLDAFVADTST